jgi:uncharacterized protein (TIGR02246 family)
MHRLAFLLLCVMSAIPAAEDERGIEAVWNQFMRAWNQHDARAFSLLFARDGDLTSWRGQHTRGRTAIEERFQPLFSGPVFKDSICSGKVRLIRFLRPDIAVVDIEWEMTGARSADGSARPLRKGLLDWVCEKQGQYWRIVAFHDVDFTASSIPAQ